MRRPSVSRPRYPVPYPLVEVHLLAGAGQACGTAVPSLRNGSIGTGAIGRNSDTRRGSGTETVPPKDTEELFEVIVTQK